MLYFMMHVVCLLVCLLVCLSTVYCFYVAQVEMMCATYLHYSEELPVITRLITDQNSHVSHPLGCKNRIDQ